MDENFNERVAENVSTVDDPTPEPMNIGGNNHLRDILERSLRERACEASGNGDAEHQDNCSICLWPKRHPIYFRCSHSVGEQCFMKLMGPIGPVDKKCPLCRSPITITEIIYSEDKWTSMTAEGFVAIPTLIYAPPTMATYDVGLPHPSAITQSMMFNLRGQLMGFIGTWNLHDINEPTHIGIISKVTPEMKFKAPPKHITGNGLIEISPALHFGQEAETPLVLSTPFIPLLTGVMAKLFEHLSKPPEFPFAMQGIQQKVISALPKLGNLEVDSSDKLENNLQTILIPEFYNFTPDLPDIRIVTPIALLGPEDEPDKYILLSSNQATHVPGQPLQDPQ